MDIDDNQDNNTIRDIAFPYITFPYKNVHAFPCITPHVHSR